jgi:hypothetical protein
MKELSEQFTQPETAGYKISDHKPRVLFFPSLTACVHYSEFSLTPMTFFFLKKVGIELFFMTRRRVYITLGLTTECFLCKSD